MRLMSSYRIIYSMIVMGSYARSFLIGSFVGLLGIGICLALEQRWRSMSQAHSDRNMAQPERSQPTTTGSETATNNPHTSCECLPLNDDSPKQGDSANELLNTKSTKEAEDDVTVLFGPLSNLSMHDKSSPGLPGMHIKPACMIHFMKQDDLLTSTESTTEYFESRETLSTNLQSEIEIDENSIEFSRITKTMDISKSNNEEIQGNKNKREVIKDPFIFSSAPIEEKADVSNTEVVSWKEQCNCSVNEENGAPDLHGPNSHVYLTDPEQFLDGTQSSKRQYKNDKQSLVLWEQSIVANLLLIEDYKEPRVDDKRNSPLPNYLVESLHTSMIHNEMQCAKEPSEDKNIPSSFTSNLTESFAPNEETDDSKTPGISKEETAQNYVSASRLDQEDYKTGVLPGLQSSNFQDMNDLVDDNNTVLSGQGDASHFSLSEETRFAQSVKDSLEDVCASISSATKTAVKNSLEDVCASISSVPQTAVKNSLEDVCASISSIPQTAVSNSLETCASISSVPQTAVKKSLEACASISSVPQIAVKKSLEACASISSVPQIAVKKSVEAYASNSFVPQIAVKNPLEDCASISSVPQTAVKNSQEACASISSIPQTAVKNSLEACASISSVPQTAVKNSLEACASISSVPQTLRNAMQDSSLEAANKKNTKCEIKLPRNRSKLNILPYADLAAIPKKAKMKKKGSSRGSREYKATRSSVDSNRKSNDIIDDMQRSSRGNAKHRVRRLVGFFENKIEKS